MTTEQYEYKPIATGRYKAIGGRVAICVTTVDAEGDVIVFSAIVAPDGWFTIPKMTKFGAANFSCYDTDTAVESCD